MKGNIRLKDGISINVKITKNNGLWNIKSTIYDDQYNIMFGSGDTFDEAVKNFKKDVNKSINHKWK